MHSLLLSCSKSLQCVQRDATSYLCNKTRRVIMCSQGFRQDTCQSDRSMQRLWQRSQLSPVFRQPVPTFNRSPWSIKCGDLRTHHAGQAIEIAGRIQNIRMNRFITLRDDSGVSQLVIPEDRPDLQRRMSKLNLDSYVKVVGDIQLRPSHSCNTSMSTGHVEVVVFEIIQIQNKRRNACDELNLAKKTRAPDLKKMTTDEMTRAGTKEMKSYFGARTTTCLDLGDLSPGDVVALCGWVRHKRMDLFIVLKDGYGEVQLVPNSKELAKHIKQVKIDDLIFVKGLLAKRPFGQCNLRIPNGSWEVAVTELTTINEMSPACPTTEGQSDSTSGVGGNEGDSSPPPPPGEITQKAQLSKYTCRTHTCGELRSANIGESVILVGWIEFVRMSKFLLLRDGYGTTQILVKDSDKASQLLLDSLDLESVVKVTGTVCSRPPGQENTKEYATGEIEVLANNIEVINSVQKALPFSIRNFNKARESLRMQHRYLDLRFPGMQRNLRLRSNVLMKMREFLIRHAGFVEIETPTLFKRTPGGAREFVVPTHQPGLFYSLVQSPQQLKQLLMVGAMDRYFQVARCYRDETTRFDRQPEFTQMDIELSFCTKEDVMQLVEDLLEYSWDGDTVIQTPFPRMTYEHAMETYGSDKPDLRIDWKLINLTDVLRLTVFDGSKLDLKAKFDNEDNVTFGFVAPKANVVYTSAIKKSLEDSMRQSAPLTTPFVLSFKAVEDGKLAAIFGGNFSDAIMKTLQVEDNCVFVFSVGPKKAVLESLGRARISLADIMEEKGYSVKSSGNHMLWVTDFPLFTEGENGKLDASHHPFTAPTEHHSSILFTDPLKVTGLHYDLVLNGSEIGGGSIRIHDGKLQEDVLTQVLDLPTDSLTHLLNALKYGAPPHGGIALGMDRLISIMAGSPSIKDVIAFPKTLDGKDLMTGAPGPLTADEKKYYHLESLERKPVVERDD